MRLVPVQLSVCMGVVEEQTSLVCLDIFSASQLLFHYGDEVRSRSNGELVVVQAYRLWNRHYNLLYPYLFLYEREYICSKNNYMCDIINNNHFNSSFLEIIE